MYADRVHYIEINGDPSEYELRLNSRERAYTYNSVNALLEMFAPHTICISLQTDAMSVRCAPIVFFLLYNLLRFFSSACCFSYFGIIIESDQEHDNTKLVATHLYSKIVLSLNF